MSEKLYLGAQFPDLTLRVDDDTLTLPEHKASGYTIVLFYRGHW
jgi:hypothetical protein